MKNKILLLLVLIFMNIFLKDLLINVWCLNTDKNYFIPIESSIFNFKSTQMNNGYGDWWLYGEDNKFYCGLNVKNENPTYFKLEKVRETQNFNGFNYHSWNVK